MLRALAVIAAFALLVYALADFANSDERDRGGIPGWLWVVLIILLPYFGPLAWIVFSRSRRGHGAASGLAARGNGPKPPRRPSGPLAPDDDPEFLWRLAREQQRQGRTGSAGGTGTTGAPDAAGTPTPGTDGQGHTRTPRDQTPDGQGSRDSTSRDQTPRPGPQDDQSPDATPDS